MPCSAVTLSLATITGIIATGLLAIAFSTDNWLYTEVKRAQIQVRTSSRVQRLSQRGFSPARIQGATLCSRSSMPRQVTPLLLGYRV